MTEWTTTNIGNLMFRYGVVSLFPDYVLIENLKRENLDELREKIDVVIYPTANQLYPGANLTNHAQFFRKLNKPVVMVGLGAQAPTQENFAKQLKPETINFFKTVSDLSDHIGVRGAFTAEVLSEIGVQNSKVIGCPSCFINQSPNLGQKIEQKLVNLKKNAPQPKLINFKKDPPYPAKVAFFPQHGNNYCTEPHADSERKLFHWSYNLRGGSYVVNGPFTVLALARRRAFEAIKPEVETLAKFLDPDVPSSEFSSKFRSISCVHPTVDGLLEYLSSCDFSLGKRVHGAFASMQSATPSLLIAHDSRTKELADTTLTPYAPIDDFQNINSLSAAIDYVDFNGAAYDRRRRANYLEFISLFEKYGGADLDRLKSLPLAQPEGSE